MRVLRFHNDYRMKGTVINKVCDGTKLYYLVQLIQIRLGWGVFLNLFRVYFMLSLKLCIGGNRWLLEIVHHFHELTINKLLLTLNLFIIYNLNGLLLFSIVI